MALARVAPPSTVVRTPTSVFWNAGFSWLAARISRHCTSGKPASIMTENWRKKIAISLTLTLLDPKVGMTNSLPFSRIAPGVICSRRNAWPRACLFGATRSPEIFCTEASLPENVKTGMVLALRTCASGRCCCRAATPVQQAGAAVNHFLELFLVTGARHGGFQRDLLLEVRRS